MLDKTDIKYFKLQVQESNIKSENLVDIQACCPVCGDSHYGNKARLHLYTKNNLTFVNCFNGGCPVENRTVFTFLRDFFPEFFNNYKRETFQSRLQNLKEDFGNSNNSISEIQNVFGSVSKGSEKSKESGFFDNTFTDLIRSTKENTNESETLQSAFSNLRTSKEPESVKSTLQKTEEIVKHINPKDKIETLALEKVLLPFKNSKAQEYLSSRGLEYDGRYGDFFYSEKDLTLDDEKLIINNSIIVPCYFNNEIYGFYSRNINKKYFHTFIWKNSGYKIWNYFNQEPNKKTYVFEGVFDQMSSGLDLNNESNIIASMGQKISNDRIKDIQEFGNEVVFVLDSDKTGLMNSLEYQKEGFSVYVPPKSFKNKDINNLKLEHKLSLKEVQTIIKENTFKGIQASIKLKQLL